MHHLMGARKVGENHIDLSLYSPQSTWSRWAFGLSCLNHCYVLLWNCPQQHPWEIPSISTCGLSFGEQFFFRCETVALKVPRGRAWMCVQLRVALPLLHRFLRWCLHATQQFLHKAGVRCMGHNRGSGFLPMLMIVFYISLCMQYRTSNSTEEYFLQQAYWEGLRWTPAFLLS